ncbi:hypothetical protein GCM10009663_10580 [Kitasatospora arboriphila]|uniref:Uncharacterized protein n=1 Tax=Kitasatospora arboriphila TaxID=258052 RepID=A0ABN1TBD3_9ACTN
MPWVPAIGNSFADGGARSGADRRHPSPSGSRVVQGRGLLRVAFEKNSAGDGPGRNRDRPGRPEGRWSLTGDGSRAGDGLSGPATNRQPDRPGRDHRGTGDGTAGEEDRAVGPWEGTRPLSEDLHRGSRAQQCPPASPSTPQRSA